jgi:hypothetical protein
MAPPATGALFAGVKCGGGAALDRGAFVTLRVKQSWPLRRAINDDPYPLSPRLAPLKAILAKLDPPQPPSGSAPPLQTRNAPSAAGRRRHG